MPDHLTIADHDEAEALLKTYSVEEIRKLWEVGAFGDHPKAVQQYIETRIIHGDLDKSHTK